MSQLYAMGVPPQAQAGGQPMPQQSPLGVLFPMLIIGVLFYFLIIRPQQKQQKERDNLLKELKEGDKVVMISGVYATVTKVEEGGEILRLQIAENVTVKAQRSAVERLQK
jgi:preprotein translocase subunit YajC